MALEMNLDRTRTENKFPFPRAYARISRVMIDTSAKNQVSIEVTVFADAEARNTEGAFSVDKRRVRAKISDLNPAGFTKLELIKAAYLYLKAQGWAGKDV